MALLMSAVHNRCVFSASVASSRHVTVTPSLNLPLFTPTASDLFYFKYSGRRPILVIVKVNAEKMDKRLRQPLMHLSSSRISRLKELEDEIINLPNAPSMNEAKHALQTQLPSTFDPSAPDEISKKVLLSLMVIVAHTNLMIGDPQELQNIARLWSPIYAKLAPLAEGYILPLYERPKTREGADFYEKLVFVCCRILVFLVQINDHYSAAQQRVVLKMEPTFVALMAKVTCNLAYIRDPIFELFWMRVMELLDEIPRQSLLDTFAYYLVPKTCSSIFREELAKSNQDFDGCVVRSAMRLACHAFTIPLRLISPDLSLPDEIMSVLVEVISRVPTVIRNTVPADYDITVFGDILIFGCRCIQACFTRSFDWAAKALDCGLLPVLVVLDEYINTMKVSLMLKMRVMVPLSETFHETLNCLAPFLILRPVLNRVLRHSAPLLLPNAALHKASLVPAIRKLNQDSWTVKCQMYQFDDNDLRSCSNHLCPLKSRQDTPKRVKFKRCTACLVATYCSKKCQKAHWKSGHQHECKTLGPDAEARRSRMASFQDEQFIKYLVHRDILTRKEYLLREVALQHPSDTIVAEYDYRKWPMVFTTDHFNRNSTKVCDCIWEDCPLEKRLRLIRRQAVPRRHVIVHIRLPSHDTTCDLRWLYLEDIQTE
ncbi:hypothetical protein VNI00_013939 [Paramarasmius palmivorus]|uniref:MYND-type domain-containing protein n=1 Tax=Paramarasmius palmivorus TaxID=297713 RepID=A0AAW0BXP6_9AGAR